MLIERRLKPQINVDLTPLIDVVFQLVIFFMISSVFNTAPGIELDLPTSETSETVAMTELRITAVSENEIYLNKDIYTLEGLSDAVRIWLEANPSEEEPSVVLEGDDQVSYQLMVSILDSLRRNGIENVGLITDPKE